MIQLYIDNKPAVMRSGTSFKLYRENIYFTDAEDYTLDVTLPLHGCPENLDIFQAIHRPEMSAVSLVGKRYPFHFVAPPLDISGTAIVTEITDIEVKVQLLAGSSVLNFDNADSLGHDIYIDELDLGRAFDVTHDISVYDGNGAGSFYDAQIQTIHSDYNNNPNRCVCFPIYSEESDTVVNLHSYYGYGYSTQRWWMERNFDKFAAQPYLLLIVQRVLQAIGYTLDPDNAIAKSWHRNVFVANGRNESEYAKILPHWTVSEFLQEVSLFCGVYFTVNGTTVSAIRKSDYYSDASRLIHITDVIDEYTTEVSEEYEGSEDPRTGNVGYDFDSVDPMLQLPDEVWENATIIELDSESTIIQWATNTGIDKAKSLWLFTDLAKDCGKVFAYIQDVEGSWFPCEVDQAGSIIRGDKMRRDTDVSLRIVPVMMVMKPAKYRWYWSHAGWDIANDKEFYAPMLKIAGAINVEQSYSVNDAINPNAETEPTVVTKPDRLEVALYDGGERSLGNYSFSKEKDDYSGQTETITDEIIIRLATGMPYVREDGVYFVELFTTTNTHKHLLLKQDVNGGMYNVLTDGKKIDTRCRKIFQFLDNTDMSPHDVFIIRGRRYACEKLEYSVEETGMSPLKRGYFYELND